MVVLIAIPIVAFLLSGPTQTNAKVTQVSTVERTDPYETPEQRQERYDYLFSHISSTNVSPKFRAVHVSEGTKMVCSGTLISITNVTPRGIITASLAFFNAKNPGGTLYDYHVLGNELGIGKYVAKGSIASFELRTNGGFA